MSNKVRSRSVLVSKASYIGLTKALRTRFIAIGLIPSITPRPSDC